MNEAESKASKALFKAVRWLNKAGLHHHANVVDAVNIRVLAGTRIPVGAPETRTMLAADIGVDKYVLKRTVRDDRPTYISATGTFTEFRVEARRMDFAEANYLREALQAVTMPSAAIEFAIESDWIRGQR